MEGGEGKTQALHGSEEGAVGEDVGVGHAGGVEGEGGGALGVEED